MVQACLASNLFLATLFFNLFLYQTAYGQLLPKCVQPCISSSATDAKCSENDFSCMCKVPLFAWTVSNCSRLYCSSNDQTTVVERINQLCGAQNTLEPTPSSSFQIFTFGGAFTPSGTASSTTGRGAGISPPKSTASIPTSASNAVVSESGKSGNMVPDSENTASPQPLHSGNSALSNWAANGSTLLTLFMFVALPINVLL